MALYSAKMGRLLYDPSTRKVTPLASKGTLTIHWQDDQKHLAWTPVDNSAEKVDIIVFQGDARFEIHKNNIFVLWFQTYEDKYFFWLQQDAVTPQQVQIQVQQVLDKEEQDAPMEIEKPELQNQAQKEPVSEKPEKPVEPTKVEGVNKLQEMIQNIMKKNEESKKRLGQLSLTKLINGDFLNLVGANATQQLLKHLPEGQQTKQFLRENLFCPQLLQGLDNLQEALYSESAASLFYEMGLDLKILEQFYGTQAILRALVKWAKDPKSK